MLKQSQMVSPLVELDLTLSLNIDRMMMVIKTSLLTMCLNWKLFSLSKLHGDWAIHKLHGSHHCWMSKPALDKGNLLQPSLASTKESENMWQGLWLPCLLRRLTWLAAETMRLSTHSMLRRLQAQTLPNATPPIGNIYPLNKTTITFEPVMQLSCPSGFSRFFNTMT